MLKPLLAVVLVLVAAAAAAAPWEGVIESRMTRQDETQGSAGTGKTYVSKAGVRSEMNLGQGERAVKMTTLNLRSKPGVTYLVNDARKTYSVVDTSRAGGQDAEPEKFSVKKLGHERVAGHDCVHALVTGEKGEEWEIWSTKDLGGAEAFWKSLEDRGRRAKSSGLYRSLQEAGLDGWPMKWRSRGKDDSTGMTWEVTKLEKRSVPNTLFDLSGYTKSEATGAAGAMGQMQLSPEQQKKLEAAIKAQQGALEKMTPEQRERYQEMMKSLGGGASERPGSR